MINIEHVSKQFGSLQVLEDISINIEQGDIFGIIGQSGAGKSTLLRCATLLETMDGGDLIYLGEYTAKADETGKSVYGTKADLQKARQHFGLVFQNFNLFPHYSVLKNITDAPLHVQKRPKDEVDGIMHLLEQYLHECIDTMEKDGNRLRFLGDLSVLTPELRELIDETNEISSRIEGFQANVCLNYGGRDEILHAARAFARDCAAGEQDADALTEEGFSRYLYSSGLPDPDLLIRPGGEKRISNYLLWQCAYSEFYFCDTLWPDFTEREFDKALIAYQHRERRFGGLKQEKQK